MGPIKASIGGCRYVLTFLCSQTEYSFVYLLKNKSEQSKYFREFKALYENKTESKVKELRSDNGLEYFSNEFQKYLKDEGIKHNTSVAYVAQSNGKAERLNLTLIGKARTMLNSAMLDQNMWGSAILTANYLRNRSPCKTINFQTPYKLMFNKNPNLKHLRIFGCKAFPLILNKQRTKFEPKAQSNCVLIGYDDSDGIYWIFNKSTRSIFRSRDVTFDEKLPNELNLSSVEFVESETEIESENENKSEIEHESEIEIENEPENTSETQFDTDENLSEFIGSNQLIRRSSRAKMTPDRLQVNPERKTYVVKMDDITEPKNISQALNGPNKQKKWLESIESELNSINENKVWTIVKRPHNRTIIGTRWIFKIKRNEHNEPEKYKARLVAKGYNQEPEIDYFDTFSPVVKIQTLRTILAISAQKNSLVHQLDINTAFLNGDLSEEIYVEAPPGIPKYNKNEVCKLNKALYGLKQASRAWNKKIVDFLCEYGLKQLKTDVCVFVNEYLIVALYVDDIIIESNDINKINEFNISKHFKTKDLGEASFILKIKIERIAEGGWKIHQQNYIDELINFYQLNNENIVNVPIQPNHRLTVDLIGDTAKLRVGIDSTKYRQAIGKLMYLMLGTRPDICYAVTVLSRFMKKPLEKHWRFVKQVLKYIKSTRNFSLIYQKSNLNNLTGYSDYDHAGDLGDRKSTSGYVFMFNNCTIHWRSMKQKTVAISSTEVEYIGMSEATKEAIWFQAILKELIY